uniref:Uncharacterized protein n=1 Tax=uncultured bacterium pAG2 TaxID=1781152 RepID=A0A1C9U4J1_9BACT|nr:hypothetical protein [uncultured bacterium pAG2]
MHRYFPLQKLPAKAGYKKGDVFVLVGELFGRGYANGIVDEARKAGMTIIGTTVGRRDSDGTLRPLTAEEQAEAEANLGGKIINIPLEAGFDMEQASDGQSYADILKSVKPDSYESFLCNKGRLEEVRAKGTARFKSNLAGVVAELQKEIPAGVNVLFSHAMAGGIPRVRLFMPLLNRVFKGTGDRYLASAEFWKSGLGELCQASFNEVSADTFAYLLEATAAVRATNEVRYTAYGYHGCEVLINGEYTWQSYTPYVQGWAKIRLEDHAIKAREQGILATVYNCPEIQTNSSALFMGVEISLYPLLEAIEKEGGGAAAESVFAECKALLNDGVTIEALLQAANRYLASPVLKQFAKLSEWPHHNTAEQMEQMLTASAELIAMNKSPKEIVCAPLSRVVFQSTGYLMFHDSWAPEKPVAWLNHDIIAKCLNS